MTDNWNADSPIIVWSDYGYEGWSPRSYPTVAAAIEAGFTYGSVLTMRINLPDVINEPAPADIPAFLPLRTPPATP